MRKGKEKAKKKFIGARGGVELTSVEGSQLLRLYSNSKRGRFTVTKITSRVGTAYH